MFLYSSSPSMRALEPLLSRAAAVRDGVMIRGEHGAGREFLARSIHARQQAPPGPFVCVDCALDGEQLEIDLFGNASGDKGHNGNGGIPHSGRKRADDPDDVKFVRLEIVSRPSVLHQVQRGTIYFKNVAETPTRLQARLARVLRDREAVLAETGDTITLDVRPMAGVEPGADAVVDEGRVREDLFRRLSAIRIDMPALRNRREDIPELAAFFVADVCKSLGLAARPIAPPALSLIVALPWRGNAVELRALLETVIKANRRSDLIDLDQVLAHVQLDGGSLTPGATGGTLRQARARFEREYISSVLEQHRGRITDAAKALGVQRTNLYRKMRSLRVSRKGRNADA
jgi:two-component system nitrogen regulation response regulator NtrX